jgi:hypothetical protein
MSSSLTPASTAWFGTCTYYGQNGVPPVVQQAFFEHTKVIESTGVTSRNDHKHPTAYSFSITEEAPFRGRLTQYDKTPYDFKQSHWIDDLPVVLMTPADGPGLLSDSRVYNKCLKKVIDQMKNSDVNLSTSIGEGRETLSMLKGLGKTAAETAVALRRSLKKRDWRLLVKTVGGIELLNALGIQPLVADVEALRKHVLSGKLEDVRFEVKGRASDKSDFVRIRNELKDYIGNVPPNFKFTEKTTVETRCQLGGYYRITDLHSYENWRAGLGLRPSLAWELTTLSWLVDYFVKVGEFLELTEAALLYNGFTLEDAYKTVSHKVVTEQIVTGRITTVVDGIYFAITEFSRNRSHKDKSRGLISSLPTPTMPTLKIPTTSTQLLNCAGLLSQLLK